MAKTLIIDGFINAIYLLDNVILKEGYETYTVNNGRAASSAVLFTKPEFILLGLIMSGISGIRASKTVNSNPKLWQVPTLIFITKGDIKSKPAAIKAGTKGFIQTCSYRGT